MDPDTNLREQRELVHSLLNENTEDSLFITNAVRLAELVQALDSWLSGNGFLPTDWCKNRGQ